MNAEGLGHIGTYLYKEMSLYRLVERAWRRYSLAEGLPVALPGYREPAVIMPSMLCILSNIFDML